MSRMSLETAKSVLKDKGWRVMEVKGGYDIYNEEDEMVVFEVNGYEVVRQAKKLLSTETTKTKPVQTSREYSFEMLAEMRSVWGPGAKVTNVLTGETITL